MEILLQFAFNQEQQNQIKILAESVFIDHIDLQKNIFTHVTTEKEKSILFLAKALNVNEKKAYNILEITQWKVNDAIEKHWSEGNEDKSDEKEAVAIWGKSQSDSDEDNNEEEEEDKDKDSSDTEEDKIENQINQKIENVFKPSFKMEHLLPLQFDPLKIPLLPNSVSDDFSHTNEKHQIESLKIENYNLKKNLQIAIEQSKGYVEVVEQLTFYKDFFDTNQDQKPIPKCNKSDVINNNRYNNCDQISLVGFSTLQNVNLPPKNLKKQKVQDENECIICMVNFDQNPKYQLQNCSHDNFHQNCIQDWQQQNIQENHKCPICDK